MTCLIQTHAGLKFRVFVSPPMLHIKDAGSAPSASQVGTTAWATARLPGYCFTVATTSLPIKRSPSASQVGTTAWAAAPAARASSRMPTTLLWLSSM